VTVWCNDAYNATDTPSTVLNLLTY